MNSVSACATTSHTSIGMTGNASSEEHDPDAIAYEAAALNDVVIALLDNVDEYRRAVFGLEQLLGTLQCHLYNRVEALEQLQSHISHLGVQPVTTRSALGTAFASLLASPKLSGRNEQEDLMQDIDRGERVLGKLLTKCLTDQSLSPGSRECVSKTVNRLSADRCRPADIWSPKCAPCEYGPLQTLAASTTLTPSSMVAVCTR